MMILIINGTAIEEHSTNKKLLQKNK